MISSECMVKFRAWRRNNGGKKWVKTAVCVYFSLKDTERVGRTLAMIGCVSRQSLRIMTLSDAKRDRSENNEIKEKDCREQTKEKQGRIHKPKSRAGGQGQ